MFISTTHVVKLKMLQLHFLLVRLILRQDMLVVAVNARKLSLLMSQKWGIIQLIRMKMGMSSLEERFLLEGIILLRDIIKMLKKVRKLLIRIDGCILVILE